MIIAVVAWDEEFGIGKDGSIPWRCKEDMAHFRLVTSGHKVVMGRKTWESIPKKFRPLPNRTNIVITRQKDYQAEGAIVSQDIVLPDGKEDLMVIGGAEIYKLYEDRLDAIYATNIKGSFSCDVKWPCIDLVAIFTTKAFYGLSDKASFTILER